MERVKELLDNIYRLPEGEFEAFDDDYKKYRILKKREGFNKTYKEAQTAKQYGNLFGTEDIQVLMRWLIK